MSILGGNRVGEPSFGAKAVGIISPCRPRAIHGPDAPDDDTSLGQKCPVRKRGIDLALFDFEGDRWIEAQRFVEYGHCVRQIRGLKVCYAQFEESI